MLPGEQTPVPLRNPFEASVSSSTALTDTLLSFERAYLSALSQGYLNPSTSCSLRAELLRVEKRLLRTWISLQRPTYVSSTPY
ncbi:Conserved oligomeric Golgi complex subunit 5like [Caligus rogercresseyi]|uniref:Conserved oligomeric Golgi complex subunit 5like n=1 Tax=Caligus rogercresseyi TaxID=217165 RepID=A0A7T8JV45_CALRO|nr:Conserved oligomeric Golgi complex subunit 5like [Caligus rogercresseyi]